MKFQELLNLASIAQSKDAVDSILKTDREIRWTTSAVRCRLASCSVRGINSYSPSRKRFVKKRPKKKTKTVMKSSPRRVPGTSLSTSPWVVTATRISASAVGRAKATGTSRRQPGTSGCFMRSTPRPRFDQKTAIVRRRL